MNSTRLPIATARQVRREVTRLVSYYRATLLWLIVLQGLQVVTGLVTPWILGRLIDDITAGTTAAQVEQWLLVLAVMIVVQAIFAFFSNRTALRLGETVFAHLREEMVDQATHLPLSLVEAAGTGDLLGRTNNDIHRVQHIVRFGVPLIMVNLATVVLTLGAAFVVSVPLAICLLAGMPFLYLVFKWYLPLATPAYRAMSSGYARMYGAANESLEQAETIAAFNLGPLRERRAGATLFEVFDLERWAASPLRAVLLGTMGFFLMGPIFLVVLAGVIMLGLGWVSAGAIAAVALYAQQLANPLFSLGFWLDEAQMSIASLARIFGVGYAGEGQQRNESAAGGPVWLEGAQKTGEARQEVGGVKIADVGFGYRADRKVLHGVDLQLRPGERLALVGPSGAGKSTLGRLLAGINAPDEGSIEIELNGQYTAVGDLDEKLLRRTIALVTQEHHVFVGTLLDNLRLVGGDLSEEQCRQALQTVGAWEWAQALPQGLQTKLGSGAHELDPGQAQQLALARLLLLDPAILILDEATSLLDPRAARDLERAMSRVLEGRTVVAIAHRLYTAQDADRVAVMIDGQVAELGTHDELLAAGGQYAALWQSWQHT